MTDFIFDLETGDPDDIFALALLATHPRSNLLAVTVHPGGNDQVGLVKHVLERLGRVTIPVGANTPKSLKPRVGEFYRKWLGSFPDMQPDGSAPEVILNTLSRCPNTQLVTGAALSNIASALACKDDRPFFSTWTCQGGFAGDNIMPPENRLPKFAGRLTCPTYNLGGDYRAAQALVNNPLITTRRFVPKSICHGMFYTPEVDDRIPSGLHSGLDLLKNGMQFYFRKRPEGKALHDAIAAAVALNPTIATWAEVKLYRTSQGEWGCEPTTENPSYIAIDIEVPEFEDTLRLNHANFDSA